MPSMIDPVLLLEVTGVPVENLKCLVESKLDAFFLHATVRGESIIRQQKPEVQDECTIHCVTNMEFYHVLL
jgi:hypothetical protein